MTTKAHHQLPGPLELAKEAWEIYKARFWIFAGIFFFTILLYIGLFAVVGILGVITFFALGGRFDSVPFILTAGVLFILFVIAMIYLSTLLQGAWVLASGGKDKIGLKETFQKARGFILPILITGSISGLITFGASLFFIIPAFLFAIWFSLGQFIVIFEKKKNLLALHTSREYIRGRFWQYIGRWIVAYLPFILIGFISGMISEEQSAASSGIFELISLFTGPFYIAYGYVLYTHLKKGVEVPKEVPSGNKKVYIGIPVIGLLLLILLSFYAVPRIISGVQDLFNQQMQERQEQRIGNPEAIQTDVYSGVLQFYTDQGEFPTELIELVDNGYVENLPTFEESEYEYVYTPTDNNQGFSLCMVTVNGSESCAKYPQVTQAPI